MLSIRPDDAKINNFHNNTPLTGRPAEGRMENYCRQVSIESPGPHIEDCVYNFEIPIPEVPSCGARIKVVCAGACYRMRNRTSSTSSTQSVEDVSCCVSSYKGIRDGALFPGYEVAGIIDAFGASVEKTNFKIGERVIIYPHEDLPHGYAEYVTVSDLDNLVSIPDGLSMSVASLLPSGALLAKSAVLSAEYHVIKILESHQYKNICKILIVGTGGLALWAIRLAEHHFAAPKFKGKVQITVACLKDEGFKLAAEIPHITLVQWNEDLFEKQLIERTKDACNGMVDIVIDFGTTSRSLHRSLQCLNEGGTVLVTEEIAGKLLPKFSKLITECNHNIEGVRYGSVAVLKDLVELVGSKKVTPPPFTEYTAEDTPSVIQKLCKSDIIGRAVLRFDDTQ